MHKRREKSFQHPHGHRDILFARMEDHAPHFKTPGLQERQFSQIRPPQVTQKSYPMTVVVSLHPSAFEDLKLL